MSQEQLSTIESAINELMLAFDVSEPPIPVEIMLQRPKAGMWKEVNLSELSTAFINIRQRYSPRMSVARLLARCVCRCEWGERHNVAAIGATDDGMRALARAILMPQSMIDELPDAKRTPSDIGLKFEVPDDDARQRLIDLRYLPESE